MSDFLVNVARRGAGLPPVANTVLGVRPEPARVDAIEPDQMAIEEIEAREPARERADPILAASQLPVAPVRSEPITRVEPLAPPTTVSRPVETHASDPARVAAPIVQRMPLAVPEAAPPPATTPSADTEPRLVESLRSGEAPRQEPIGVEPTILHVPRPIDVERPLVTPPPAAPLMYAPSASVERVEVRSITTSAVEASHIDARAGESDSRTADAIPVRALPRPHIPLVEPTTVTAPVFGSTRVEVPVPSAVPAPSVEVHIGSVEIHAAPPPPPPMPVAAAPETTSDVFESFTRVRRHAPWSR